jgi:glycosyltransferase involved in cell wall biosynthesis
MKNILHLNSYYIDTHLYSKIYKKLAHNYKQTVYIPIKEGRKQENNISIPRTDLVFSELIKKYHAIFHAAKISLLTRDLEDRELYEDIDIVHAHNLYTDGAIALNLKKKYGLKYIVSVRMTDISMQYKYMLHRRKIGREILLEAEYIIFISPLYKDRLYGMMSPEFVSNLENKTVILPNGIDDFWLESVSPVLPYNKKEPFRLIYIGQIIKRKNLDKVLNVISHLNKRGENIKLTVIGGEYPAEKKFYQQVIKQMEKQDYVQYKGIIRDHMLLENEIVQNHALIMPSVNELFGLVFIEAISQNTAVVYPKNEGIASYLDNRNVGVSVDAQDEHSIEQGILQLKKDYNKYGNISQIAKKFDWNIITKKFSELYKENLNEQD